MAVGITTRNRPASLRRCVKSLSLISDVIDEIIVGDDASEVPAQEQLSGQVPPELAAVTKVVRPAEKAGYIVARNSIVGSASCQFVLLLDDDACLLDGQSIKRALELISNGGHVGAVAFAQANANGEPWPETMQPSTAQYACYVPSFIGFAHLLRRDVFLRLGGYRSAFYFYGEEKEYCLRLLNAGFQVVYLPDARVAHLPDAAGRSSRTYLRYVVRNDCLGAVYNDPWWRLLWMVPARLMLYFRMRRGWQVEDPGGFLWVVREFAGQLPSAWRQRQPVRRTTLKHWRELRRSAPAYDPSGVGVG